MTTVLEPATATTTAAASAVNDLTGLPDAADVAVAAPVDPLVRVVKGSLAVEELAALTAVLLARAASYEPGASLRSAHARGKGHKTQAHWQRPERRPDYRSPVSWHN